MAWAARMLIDLVEHWHKRGPAGLDAYDPANLDTELYEQLVAGYHRQITPVSGFSHQLRSFLNEPEVVNDFSAAGITCDADVIERFTSNFFFGCEAEDPLASLAFDRSRLPGGTRLKAFFSSDIGHWDVPEMADVLPEAHEHLEHGWMDAAQFRDFMCDDIIRFYTDTNPEFFAGTAVADYASRSRPRLRQGTIHRDEIRARGAGRRE